MTQNWCLNVTNGFKEFKGKEFDMVPVKIFSNNGKELVAAGEAARSVINNPQAFLQDFCKEVPEASKLVIMNVYCETPYTPDDLVVFYRDDDGQWCLT
jgi:hypothetical protein